MHTSRRAFTLTELLVVAAIIVIVLTLLLASLRGVTDASRNVDSMNALRQTGMAHSTYSTDNKQIFIPGYINDTVITNTGIEARGPAGNVLSTAATRSWVWRLAPYAGDSWQTFYRDFRDSSHLETLSTQINAGDFLTASMAPSYGMNSIFIGGDSDHGGSEVTKWSPWGFEAETKPSIAATRMSQVKNPSRLIVFGPAQNATPAAGTELTAGYPELRAPFLRVNEQQWLIGEGNSVEQAATLSTPAGLPKVRAGDKLFPTARLDGSTSIDDLADLSIDMRFWAPLAIDGDYRVPN